MKAFLSLWRYVWLIGLLLPMCAVAGTTGAIDAKTFKQLNRAKDYVADAQYEEALAVLEALRERKSVKGYARAQVLNYQGYVYASTQAYTQAIDSYQQVLTLDDVPTALTLNAHYVIGQLYFQIEQYDSALASLLRWKSLAKTPSAVGLVMLSQCYYQNAEYSKSLETLSAGIAMNTDKQVPVPEQWWQLQAALYFALDDIPNTVTTYETLLRQYPKARYLKQLAGLYGETGQKKRRLSTFDAAYEQGLLSLGSEKRNLANMYLAQGVPFKAAQLIEEALSNGELEANLKYLRLLASVWALAGEHAKAIDAYHQAAKVSDDGEIDARLAAVYYDAGEYRQCIQSAREASAKGGLLNPGRNQLLLGLALVNVEKYADALQAFRRSKDDKKTFDAAKEWEKYTLSQLALESKEGA